MKKSYTTPELTVFGTVETLTQASTTDPQTLDRPLGTSGYGMLVFSPTHP